MKEHLKFYIGGRWVEPVGNKTIDVVNPATEEVIGRVTLGTAEDVDRAVAAARKAFETFSQTTKQERIALIERIQGCYQERLGDLAETVTLEMGAPKWLATAAQAPVGLAHIAQTLQVLKGSNSRSKEARPASSRNPSACAASSRRGTGRSIR